MPVRERAAFGVLAGDADRDPVDEETRERERLRLAPVDSAFLDRSSPPLELRRELRMDRERLGHSQQLLVEDAQLLGRERRRDRGTAAARHPVVLRLGRDRRAEGALERLVRRAY